MSQTHTRNMAHISTTGVPADAYKTEGILDSSQARSALILCTRAAHTGANAGLWGRLARQLPGLALACIFRHGLRLAMQVWGGTPGILGTPKAMPELLNCSLDVHAPKDISSCT